VKFCIGDDEYDNSTADFSETILAGHPVGMYHHCRLLNPPFVRAGNKDQKH
jgi:hypothetical protein